MRESLGEVADQPAARGVVFFGEKPEIVADRQQPLEQLLGIVASYMICMSAGYPATARRSQRMSTTRQPI